MHTTPTPTSPIAIIGIGNMGGGMASNLLSKGYAVHVHDIDPSQHAICIQKGAVAHQNIAGAASKCVATIVCVVDALQTEQVLFGTGGVAASVPTGHTVLLCPTIAPLDVERFAAQLAQHGIHTIDAPMSGGPVRAADGSMSLMVACADAVFDQHARLLNDLSSKLFRISQRPGDGARTKLVNNLLAGINLVGAAEALAMARRMGLDVATTQSVISQSSGQSWIGSDRMQRALAGDFAPRAHMTLLAKDTALAVQAACQMALSGGLGDDSGKLAPYPGPLGQHAAHVFAQALAAGLADQDDCALFNHLQTTPVGK
jgi:L-threonate 2-dehydrogenase